MDHLSIGMLALVVLGGFAAAFVDSVVGGGGLISVPVLLTAGLPPAAALGTNKLAGTLSSLTSTLSFFASGHVDVRAVRGLIPLSLLGAAAGTLTLRHVPSGFLKPMVVAMLAAIAVYTLLRRDWGERAAFVRFTAGTAWMTGIAAFALGFYDGFFGPGTGSFLIFAFLLLGFDFVKAAGNAKALNFASNLASLATFLVLGSVHYGVGLLMGAAMIAGSWIGSRFAIRRGRAYIKPLFLAVCALLIGKQVLDLL
ncbi:TSUP family transporter [Cohnella ginsengisoli]|uniref:Probable membrane transporter protein n=1 Tax=Cohnella ginsengisoli TaxID=425004 RepID=A0A9X4KF40_9BACL|nr:TSUP family transporter [Cohnella ginsengisoli]MDG0791009.1 TSUP family transporter [Cohnella ginsengisoli]